MTGSPLVPLVTAIVSVIALAAWLAILFYADAHPPRLDNHAVAGRDSGSDLTGGDLPAAGIGITQRKEV